MATETFIIDIRTRGTKRSAADVRRIGQSANQVRKTLAFLRNALVAVAAVRVFSRLVGSLVNFSDQMLVVKAVTNATTAEFTRMRDVAKGLGATTRFTAAEAAEGMAFLARAGFEVNEVMTAIPATLDLAAAAQLDLGNAADIASNLMTSFGLSVSDLPDVIDTLVFTANNANTSVQQLADGLKLFAPLASQFGISIEQASSAMGVLGDSGIQASLAGTGLRRIITDLEAPTGALAKILKIAGVAFDDVRPSANDLSDILETLTEAQIGASAASLAFGKRGGFVFAALQRQRQAFKDLTEAQKENTGVAKKNAEIMEEGLGGALRLVRSALQNLLIAFADLGGETFLNDFFRNLAEGLRVLARHADEVVAVIKVMLAVFVVAKIISFTKAIWLSTAAFRFQVKALNVIPGAALRARSALHLLRTTMLAIPFVAIAAAIVGLTVAMVAFRDNIKLLTDDGGTLNDVFTTLGNTLGDEITKGINALGFDFKDFGNIFDSLVRRFGSGVEGIISVFIGLQAAVTQVFKLIGVKLFQFAKEFALAINKLKAKVNEVSNFVGGGDIFEGLDKEFRVLTDNIVALTHEFNTLPGAIDAAAAAQKNFLDTRKDVTAARLNAARDARIVAEEIADRAAARKDKPVPEAFLGDPFDIAGGADSAAKAFDSLRASLDPLFDGMTQFKEATEAAAKAIAEQNLDVTIADEVTNLLARDLVGLSNAEFELTQRLKLVKELHKTTALSIEEQALATRKLKVEAQGAFVSMLNGVAPLLAVNQRLAEIQLFVDENQKLIVKSGLSVADVQQRMAREAFGLTQTHAQFNEEIEALIKNQDLLGLSTAELEHEIRKLNITRLEGQRDSASGAQRAFLKLQDDATNAAAITEKAFTDAFKNIEDAVVEFAQTGKFSVNDFFRNFSEQLLRLGTQQAIAGIGSAFAGAGGGFGGGIGGPSAGGAGIGGLISGLLFGAKHGGSFTVGASTAVQSLPGIDNRLIAFKARDNEDVTITPKNQGPGAVGGPMNIVFNVETKDADSFVRSQSQLQNRLLAATSNARRRR